MTGDNKSGELPDDCEKVRRGRPPQMKLAAREAAILRVAAQLLLETPFDKVTMAAIADKAGMSKRTVYEIFNSREELLVRAVINVSGTIFLPLKDEERDLPLSERLSILLRVNTPSSTDHNKLELLRSVIAKARTYPDLAYNLYTSSKGTLAGFLRAELLRAIESGEISLSRNDIELAIEMLMDMALENPLPQLLQPDATPTSEREKERRLQFAITLFLRGLAP